jgi:hypothetical protein
MLTLQVEPLGPLIVEDRLRHAELRHYRARRTVAEMSGREVMKNGVWHDNVDE